MSPGPSSSTGVATVVLRVLRSRWPLIVVAALAMSGAAFWFLASVPDKYQAVSVVSVVPDPDFPTSADLVQLAVARDAVYLSSDRVVERVAKDFGMDSADLQSAIDVSFAADSANIQIAVTLDSAQGAAAVANRLSQEATSFSRSDATMNVAITSPAEIPSTPVSPERGRILALVLLIAAGLGVVTAVIIESNEPRLLSKADVETAGGAPVIGALPRFAATREPLELLRDRHVGPAVRSLRTALSVVSNQTSTTRSIAVLEPAGAGAFTVAGLLSASVALGGRSVLLVDAHLARPAVTQWFQTPDTPGLIEVLSGTLPMYAVTRTGPVEGLSVVGTRSLEDHVGQELLRSGLPTTLAQARTLGELAIFDAAPLRASGTARVVASAMDGVLLVVGYGSPARYLREAAGTLRGLGVPILGSVITGAARTWARPATLTSSHDATVSSSKSMSVDA